MEILKGVEKLRGRPAEIPDCSRDDLPEFFKKMGFKTGVEIGVFKGEYTEILAKAGFKIYGIDPWTPYKDYTTSDRQKWLENLYQIATKKLAPYPNVAILREKSMEAVRRFGENSLDFVYIDGNHHFKYVAEDIYEWALKVKEGGIVAGHDYAYFKRSRYPGGGCQVREVIDAFAQSYDLDFWVLGRRKVIEGEKRDRMRSWMFIKTWKNQ